MNFDDHDWEIGHRRADDFRDPATFWKVATGVAFGAVLGGALVYAVDRYETQAMLAEAVQSLELIMRNAEPASAGAVAPAASGTAATAAAAGSAPPLRDPAPEERSTDAAHAPAGQDPSTRDAQQARRAQLAAERKARAWTQFYKKPAQCDDNSNRTTMVECANHYIRARRHFEEAYANGQR